MFTTNPLHSLRRQKFTAGFDPKPCKNIAIVTEPTVKSCVTHACSVCQFVLVIASHCLLLLFHVYFAKLRKNVDICKFF